MLAIDVFSENGQIAKSFLPIFTTTGWRPGSRVHSGAFSEWSRVPLSIFRGGGRMRERLGLSLGLSAEMPI